MRHSAYGRHGDPAHGLPDVAAAFAGGYPVRWTGGQAVITLPQHIDVSNVSQVSEELLTLINRGATDGAS
jgi:hypothetical protein